MGRSTAIGCVAPPGTPDISMAILLLESLDFTNAFGEVGSQPTASRLMCTVEVRDADGGLYSSSQARRSTSSAPFSTVEVSLLAIFNHGLRVCGTLDVIVVDDSEEKMQRGGEENGGVASTYKYSFENTPNMRDKHPTPF